MRKLVAAASLAVGLVLFGAAAPAWASGDYNSNGVVDLDDLAEFSLCLTGPGGEGLSTGCDVFDFDTDTDVGLDDFASLQRIFGTLVIDSVTVGNPGNSGENSGESAPNGFGPDRICGAVGYVYKIGRFEVTAGQYCTFLNSVGATDTYGLYNTYMGSDSSGCQITRTGKMGSYTYDFSGRPSGTEADWVDRPVNYVSWGDAARFANWLHNGQPKGAQDVTTTEDGSYFLNGVVSNAELLTINRELAATWVIPSEDEWYKAAYHKNDGVTGHYFIYPTSNVRFPSNDLVDPDPGNNATFLNFDGEYTIGSPYWRTEVGAHDNSGSPYGTFDQGGNVWEWNEAVFSIPHRGLRGGSFYFYVGNTMHAAHRGVEPPAFESHVIGFRVAEDPRPREVDFDGDGNVDLRDFGLLQAEYDGDLHSFASFETHLAGP